MIRHCTGNSVVVTPMVSEADVPSAAVIVTVQLPAATGVTVNVACGPEALLGEMPAMVLVAVVQVLLCVNVPVSPLRLTTTLCALAVPADANVRAVSGAPLGPANTNAPGAAADGPAGVAGALLLPPPHPVSTPAPRERATSAVVRCRLMNRSPR
jgi:hypothetical protein